MAKLSIESLISRVCADFTRHEDYLSAVLSEVVRARKPDRFGGRLLSQPFWKPKRRHCFVDMALIEIHGVWGNVAKPIAKRFICQVCGEIDKQNMAGRWI